MFAQTDPRTLPAIDPASTTYVGSFRVPREDGAGSGYDHTLMYGGYALGIGPDGKSLYFGCHDYSDRLARVSIPAMGGVASIVEPCTAIPGATSLPGNGNGQRLGGALYQGGRLIVTAHTYYTYTDQGASHWFGAGLSSLAGPVVISGDSARRHAGAMATIPVEWRALFGGSALTGQCCLPIVSTSSLGPQAAVFSPETLSTGTNPGKTLVSYPDGHQTVGDWDNGRGNLIEASMSTRIAGMAFPAGSSSVLFLSMEGSKWCYGGATDDPALDGKPIGNGQIWCYDPTGGGTGPHGYPYIPALWVYKATDLLDVKEGRKQPWDIKPTAIVRLPGQIEQSPEFFGATYDPATRRLYASLMAGGEPTVYVWQIGTGGTPPPPVKVDCTLGPLTLVDAESEPWPTTCPASGQRTRQEIWRTPVLTPAQNNGTCNVITEVRTGTQACTPPPPVNVCNQDPLTVTSVSWPNVAEGRRSGTFTFNVPNVVVTLKNVVWKLELPASVTVTDSRDCTTVVFK